MGTPGCVNTEPEEREFVVDSGASMHMVRKKTQLCWDGDHEDIDPATVMTANGEAQTREEATVYVKQLDLFVKVMMILEEIPAVLCLEKLCGDHGYAYHWTSGQKPHLIRNGKRIDCIISNYVPFVVPGLSASSSSTTPSPTSPSSSSQDSVLDVNRYTENPAPERSGSTSEERRRVPLHESTETENKNQNEEREEVQRNFSQELPDGLLEFRENLVDESTSTELWANPEQGSQDTSKSSHELPMEPRAKVGSGSGKQCKYALSEAPNLWSLLEDENNKGFLQKTYWYSRAQSGIFFLVTWSKRITKFSVKKVNRETIIDTLLWYKTWQHSGYDHTRVKQKLPRRPKRAWWSSWRRRGNQKSFTLSVARNCPGIIVRQHHTDQKTNGIAVTNGGEDSMECHCYLRNIQDLLSDGKTPCDRRFGMPLNGPVTQFAAVVEYHPISAKDQSRLHQFGGKVLPGIFLGYALHAGGIWEGDIVVADIEELEHMDASELHARRLNAKEVLTPQRSGKFIFPIADGTVKVFGWEQRLRTSTLNQDRPERGEEQEILEGKSDELHSPTHFKKTQRGMLRKLKVTSGPLQENSFIVITWNPESNCTCREKNHFIFRWSTSTLPEQHVHHWTYCWRKYWRLLERGWRKKNCQMHGQVSQDSFYWTKGHLTDIHGRARLARKQTTSRPDNVWPDMWKRMTDAAKK